MRGMRCPQEPWGCHDSTKSIEKKKLLKDGLPRKATLVDQFPRVMWILFSLALPQPKTRQLSEEILLTHPTVFLFLRSV